MSRDLDMRCRVSIDEFELRAEDAHAVAFAHERLVALLHRARAAIVHPDRNAQRGRW